MHQPSMHELLTEDFIEALQVAGGRIGIKEVLELGGSEEVVSQRGYVDGHNCVKVTVGGGGGVVCVLEVLACWWCLINGCLPVVWQYE